jgi:hypothetical protein
MPRLRYIEETTDKITASTRSRRTCCRARSAPTEADCVAECAVRIEPVSDVQIPVIREKNREFYEFKGSLTI